MATITGKDNDDRTTALLEDLYTQAVRRGDRDDPLIARLCAELEARKPKEPEPKPGEVKNSTVK